MRARSDITSTNVDQNRTPQPLSLVIVALLVIVTVCHSVRQAIYYLLAVNYLRFSHSLSHSLALSSLRSLSLLLRHTSSFP